MDIAQEFSTPKQDAEKRKAAILEKLNDAQKEVVKNYKGFSLVSAGPGSGKTFTLVQRTAYMIEDGVPAANILLFTFTKKAANEIDDRIKSTIGDRACGVSVSTYHSFCARQLRRYCTYLNYKDNFSIIDDDDQLNESKTGLGTKLFHMSFLPFFVLRRILYHRHAARVPISHTRGHGLDIRIYRYLSKALVILIIGR